MLNSPRWLLVLVSVSFAVFHATLGALAWRGFDNHLELGASIFVYLVTVLLAVLVRPGLAMGRALAALSAFGGVTASILANLGIGQGNTGTYASWYVGGMGVLLGIVAVRGEAACAWLGALIVTVLVIQKAGPEAIGPSGLVGMAILIAAGQATSGAMARADREVEGLQEIAIRAQAAIIAAEAAGVERRERLQKVLTRALPALSYIASNGGKLTDDLRPKLVRLEASLRDDIRGRRLINNRVQAAAQAARERGVQVLLMDEGGLDEVAEDLREKVLAKVADALDSVQAGKVVIRSPKGENWLVTVAATRPGTSTPDLWLKF